jgi:hypothetical protein
MTATVALPQATTKTTITRGRGKSQHSIDLIGACSRILEAIQPCTVRGVCYQLFTQGLIRSMAKSEIDLPGRLAEYGGKVRLERVALSIDDVLLGELRGFDADLKKGTADKKGDSRYDWYGERYGHSCWELDALSPNILRDRVKAAVASRIEPKSWKRYDLCEQAEQKSLTEVLDKWSSISKQGSKYEGAR